MKRLLGEAFLAVVAAVAISVSVMLALFTWGGWANPPLMDELLVTLLVIFLLVVAGRAWRRHARKGQSRWGASPT